jgi:aryl-alcohol dehydrogenase-like predicted oxidoreductase
MQALVAEGKVVALGSSNVNAGLVRDMGRRVAATQIEWNLLTRGVEVKIVPAARDLDVSVVPYFPLASGLLTGKYRRGQDFPAGSRLESMPYFASIATDENLDRVERFITFAEGRGHTLLELSVAWLLAQDTVASVICGATSPEQVRANAAAAQWRLSADDLVAIDECLA